MEKTFLFDELFNPVVSYEGAWVFNIAQLKKCVKPECKKRLKNYIKEHFKKSISDIMDWEPIKAYLEFGNLYLKSIHNENLVGRKLVIDKYSLYLAIFQLLGLDNIFMSDFGKLEVEEDELFNIFREALLQYKLECIDVRDLGVKSQFYEKYAERCKLYNISRKKDMDVITFVSILLRAIMGILPKIKRLNDFCDKEINLSEIKDLLDLDKFYLLMAKILLDTSKHSVELVGQVQNSLVFCEKYLEYLKCAFEENQHYDAFIIIDGKKYRVDDFIKEYEQMKFEHPEFKVVRVSLDQEDDLDKYKDIAYSDQKAAEVADKFYGKDLKTRWEVLPKGKKVETTLKVKSHFGSTDRLFKEDNIIRCKNFLDQTDPVMIISGLDDFSGYVGYVYANGIVVFEKFFEYYIDSENYRIAIDNATYVMNIDNFVEMSKMTKLDLIRLLKEGKIEGLVRISHDHQSGLINWKRKVLAMIMASDYQLSQEEIYQLIKRQVEA